MDKKFVIFALITSRKNNFIFPVFIEQLSHHSVQAGKKIKWTL